MRTPLLAADLVLQVDDGLVLIRRKNPPFQGSYALPGGFVEVGETVEDTARREAREETGLEADIIALVGVYSNPRRDPRGHVVSICYLARGQGEPHAGSDAGSVDVFDPSNLPPLAFDHRDMIADALKLSQYTSSTSDGKGRSG